VIPVPAGPVLPALDDAARAPTATGLAAALGAVLDQPDLGAAVAAQVVDLGSGEVLLDRSADRAAVPASTAKILTAVAVLALRGPESTLVTRVLQSAPGRLVLVGGGDVLLAAGAGDADAVVGHAGLADLAAATARALGATGTGQVTLAVDDTLFAGPGVSPGWGGDVAGGFVAPVTALAMDAGNVAPGRRPAPGLPFPRSADPTMAAADAFARALADQGITVTGAVSRRDRAVDPTAPVLAEVRSAPLADLVEQSLTDSDNTAAEALARLVSVSTNHQATFSGAGRAVLETLATLGVPTDGQTMAGGSGLGTGYALTPATLVAALRLAASAEHPELRAALTGLPVAGGSGTLVARFTDDASRPARGSVRAKTGTLTGASSLAGTVVDADGRMLAFAVLADRVSSTEAARTALDRAAAVLAGCGCR
jgi:D-alanyl-D-alanine carboxypeptidase/D-alanyl-D-alanine-endopeptidase (penicillin-binding protein 4)